MALETAIVYQVFNRPELTRRSFAVIAAARPTRLFVLADGPRWDADRPACAEVREIVSAVDWDCDVEFLFSDVNLGCRARVTSGFERVFSVVDEMIFVEDDVVPDPSFFPYCEALLAHYRDDPTVFMVCASNYLQEWRADARDYHLSRIGSPWGFGTWKRAWAHYTERLDAWTDPGRRERIRALLDDDLVFGYEADRFDGLASDPDYDHGERRPGQAPKGAWDLHWLLTRLDRGGRCVVPSRNLAENIGHRDGLGVPPDHPIATLVAQAASLPVRFHDDPVDREYDRRHVARQLGFTTAGAVPTAGAPRAELRRIVPRRVRSLARRIGRRTRGAGP